MRSASLPGPSIHRGRHRRNRTSSSTPRRRGTRFTTHCPNTPATAPAERHEHCALSTVRQRFSAMLLGLFNEMRAAKVPVSVRELLDLIDALKHRVVFADMDEFYFLAQIGRASCRERVCQYV